MSDNDLLGATTERILETIAPGRVDVLDPRLWEAFETAGLTLLGIPESSGGSGGSLAHAALVARLVGRHAAPTVLAENAMTGAWLLAQCGCQVPSGPLVLSRATSVTTLRTQGTNLHVSATLAAVPWGRFMQGLVLIVPHDDRRLALTIGPTNFTVRNAANLAGEPRDEIVVSGTVRIADVTEVPSSLSDSQIDGRLALARAIIMVGALEHVLRLTLDHARDRRQFGRSILQFQAVQQQVAAAAGAVAVAMASVDVAISSEAWVDAGAAKLEAGEAARLVCKVAHQLHGAIGSTREHQLHRWTLPLSAWRDECGSEAQWARTIGDELAALDGPEFWESITSM